MSNSIDINLNSENNSMNSLVFHWTAILNDSSKIEQFDEQGIEHRFQEVKDNFDNLLLFSLRNKDHSQCFVVDLYHGWIIFNNYKTVKIDTIKKNIRLIFFRRHKVELNESLNEKKHNINYHLGLQYNDENNTNHQILLCIDSEGNWILGE